MMIPERPALERRVLTALDGSAGAGPRIPVVLGGSGSGRTSLLLRLRDLIGRHDAQYVDVERVATTPERFLKTLSGACPFPPGQHGQPADGNARDAFDATLAFLDSVRAPEGGPATFLLDEFLELRTFESFPGLRSVLRDLIAAIGGSGNRFVLTTRYTARAHRLLRDAPSAFEIIQVSPLSAAEIRATLPAGEPRAAFKPGSFTGAGFKPAGGFKDDEDERERDELARMVQVLADGRPSYARLLVETATAMAARAGADPMSALAALMAPGGALTTTCQYSYELRLHRARGYGALKAILEVLADQEPLTLTEIALRLRRTPGSTKDYLSWLEDVDLITSRQKRYSFADPVLRLWVRLHCRATPPTDEEVAQEVHSYVMTRLPQAEPAMALAGTPEEAEPEKSWGIIEID